MLHLPPNSLLRNVCKLCLGLKVGSHGFLPAFYTSTGIYITLCVTTALAPKVSICKSDTIALIMINSREKAQRSGSSDPIIIGSLCPYALIDDTQRAVAFTEVLAIDGISPLTDAILARRP